MADKNGERQKLKEQIDRLRHERDSARADLADMERGMWGMLHMEDIGADELAVGLAFIASIVSSWPNSYVPDVPTLAALAHVPNSTVQVAFNAFAEAGVLFVSET